MWYISFWGLKFGHYQIIPCGFLVWKEQNENWTRSQETWILVYISFVNAVCYNKQFQNLWGLKSNRSLFLTQEKSKFVLVYCSLQVVIQGPMILLSCGSVIFKMWLPWLLCSSVSSRKNRKEQRRIFQFLRWVSWVRPKRGTYHFFSLFLWLELSNLVTDNCMGGWEI